MAVVACDEMRPAVSESIEWVLFDDDGFSVVLYDERDHGRHVLNPVSSAVWSLIDGNLSVGELIDDLAGIFGLEADQIRGDVFQAIDNFWTLGALEGSPSPSVMRGDGSSPVLLPRAPDP